MLTSSSPLQRKYNFSSTISTLQYLVVEILTTGTGGDGSTYISLRLGVY